MDDCFETKDKQITPYLFTCSHVQFQGVRAIQNVIYFRFSPTILAQELAYRFITRKADPVQPKDLLEAVETYKISFLR